MDVCFHLYCLCVCRPCRQLDFHLNSVCFPMILFFLLSAFLKTTLNSMEIRMNVFMLPHKRKPKPLSPHHKTKPLLLPKSVFLYLSPFTFQCMYFVCKYTYFYNGKRFRIHPLKKNVQRRYKVRTVFILCFFVVLWV